MPIGTRRVSASLPWPAGEASIGTTSPASLRASTAAIVYVETAREASTLAAFIGFLRADRPCDLVLPLGEQARDAVEDRARSCAGIGSHCRLGCVERALGLFGPALGTRPTSEPSYGERTSIHSPVSTHSLPIRRWRSVAVVAMR